MEVTIWDVKSKFYEKRKDAACISWPVFDQHMHPRRGAIWVAPGANPGYQGKENLFWRHFLHPWHPVARCSAVHAKIVTNQNRQGFPLSVVLSRFLLFPAEIRARTFLHDPLTPGCLPGQQTFSSSGAIMINRTQAFTGGICFKFSNSITSKNTYLWLWFHPQL